MNRLNMALLGVLLGALGILGAYSRSHGDSPQTSRHHDFFKGDLASDIDLKDAGKVMHGWLLTATAEHATIDSGKPIAVDVTLKNVTQGSLPFGRDDDPERDFYVVVKDQNNNLVPLTQYGHEHLFSKDYVGAGNEDGPPQFPNDISLSRRMIVSQIYDMSAEGTYSVTVKRRIVNYQQGTSFYVVSPTLQVKVQQMPYVLQPLPASPTTAKKDK